MDEVDQNVLNVDKLPPTITGYKVLMKDARFARKITGTKLSRQSIKSSVASINSDGA